uniref:Uncharacterized protein n=1 Tax=Physcomitrium patens TaxID=3218 RepID=A9TWB0_PHYPA|nr:hypothetical protein PHYPA_021560 [Physcomitrium patens]
MAIDGLATKLITAKGRFNIKLFQSLNPDPKLLAELYPTQLEPALPRSLTDSGTSNEDLITDDVAVPCAASPVIPTTRDVSPKMSSSVAAVKQEVEEKCRKLIPPLVCMST